MQPNSLGSQDKPKPNHTWPKWLVRPHLLFAVLAGCNAILLVFLTPPFEVHDEFQHFFRSYQLSEGEIYGKIHAGRAGGSLPTSLPQLVSKDWGTLEIWTIPPFEARPLARTLEGLRQPLESDRRAFADFSGAAAYSPLPYIPQAAAIAFGRLFELPPLLLLYLGRLANAATSIGIIAAALRILPYGRPAALAAALLPMAQYEYASLAPDAVIIATAYLFTALALRAVERRRWTPGDALLATLSGIVFCSIKIVYAPLLFIGLPALIARSNSDVGKSEPSIQAALVQTVIVLASIGSALFWLKSSAYLSSAFLTGARIHRESSFLIGNPVETALLLARDSVHHAAWYLKDTIGIFGAGTVYMPNAAYLIAVLALAFGLNSSHGPPQITWHLVVTNIALTAGIFVGLQLAMAVLNNSPGDWIIAGVQGRYFLPAGMLAAVTFGALIPRRYRLTKPILSRSTLYILLIGNTALMDISIVQGFKLFG